MTSNNTTHISNPEDLNSIEKALESKGQTSILAKSPATLSYYDIQRLVYLQKHSDSSKLLVRFPYRLHSEIQGLHYKLKKAGSEGNKIISVSVHCPRQPSENPSSTIRFVIDHIDLILYLSSQNVNSVQGFSEEPTEESQSASVIQHLNDRFTAEESSQVSFTLVAGTFVSGGSFSLHIGTQNTGKNVSNVQVSLSNGEVFNASISSDPDEKIESDTDSDVNYGNIEDVAKALRVYRCAVYSLDTAKKITMKHNGDKIVPIRVAGTADFLREGLFLPTDTNRKVAVSGIFSKSKPEKVKEIFNKQTLSGEPFEYIPSLEAAFKNPYTSKDWKPMYYLPSIPGSRKDKEMLDALNAGYVVLAEKPAFANAESARAFLQKLDKEQQGRLFFGWHYVHSYTLKKVLEDVNSKKFGKVKHVKTFFSVPKLLADSRIFDPTQGGAGLDVFSYNLHYVLRVVGFDQSYEIVQSNIKNAQYLDPSDPKLAKIDFTLDTKLKFGNGVTADLYATFDVDKNLYTEAEIWFEDGTKLLSKEYIHPINTIRTYFDPVLIFKAGGVRWEEYFSEEDKKHPDYWRTTYEGQLEFMRKQATGEGKYDVVNKDVDGLGVETNIKVHEIIDAVLVAGGFEKKQGA